MDRLSRRAGLAAMAVALLALPRPAAAQRDQVYEALRPFFQSLAGVYGDEGSRLPTQLDALGASLAAWDRGLQARERGLRARLTGADAATALEIHAVLAALYAERNRFADALREIDAGIQLDPKRLTFYRFKALLYQATSRPAEAAEAYRAAWLIDPDDAQSAYQLVIHRAPQTTAAEVERAIATLRAREHDVMRGVRSSPAAQFLTLNAIDEDLGGGTAFAPAHYASGFDLLFKGEFEGAMKALRSAAATDPLLAGQTSESTAMRRGIAALRQGQATAATRALETAASQLAASSEAHRVAAIAYAVNGDTETSLRHLREAVRLNPRDERSWLALAQLLDQVGRPQQAADELRKALEFLPEAGAVRWTLSALSAKREQTSADDVALIGMAERLVLVAGRADMHARLARLAWDHLDEERAVRLAERQVELTPNAAGAHRALGMTYIARGRADAGFAELAMALLFDPADGATLTELGVFHLSAGEYEEAVSMLRKAVVATPSSRPALQALGQALIRAGKETEGRSLMAQAAQLQNAYTERQRQMRTAGALRSEAEQQMTQGRTAEAITTLQQVIPLEPSYADNHLQLAEALAAEKRLPEAVTHLQTAISLNAGADAHRRLAEAYGRLGRAEDAARERQAYTQMQLRDLQARAGQTVR